DVTVRVTVVTAVLRGFFWTICTHGSDQVVLQRYFSTRSRKAAAKSYLVNIFADICMVLLLGMCGLALLAYYMKFPLPSEITGDQVFPYFISHAMPPGFGGIVIAALVAAAMSSIDSGVNAIAAVVTTDIVE